MNVPCFCCRTLQQLAMALLSKGSLFSRWWQFFLRNLSDGWITMFGEVIVVSPRKMQHVWPHACFTSTQWYVGTGLPSGTAVPGYTSFVMNLLLHDMKTHYLLVSKCENHFSFCRRGELSWGRWRCSSREGLLLRCSTSIFETLEVRHSTFQKLLGSRVTCTFIRGKYRHLMSLLSKSNS